MMKVISDAYCKQVSEQDGDVNLKGGKGAAVDMDRVKAEIMEQVGIVHVSSVSIPPYLAFNAQGDTMPSDTHPNTSFLLLNTHTDTP